MAVREKKGRRWSERTEEENLELLTQEFGGLDENEAALLEALMAEMGDGGGGLADLSSHHVYEHEPVSMAQFLDDEYYLGDSTKTLYPKVREDLLTIANTSSMREVVLTGSLGLDSVICESDGGLPTLGERIGVSKDVVTIGDDGASGISTTEPGHHSGVKIVRKLRLANGAELMLTPEHKVQVFRDGKIRWVECQDIREGEFCAVARVVHTTPSTNPSEDLVKLFAYWSADGYSRETGAVYCDGNPETSKELVQALARLGFESDRMRRGNCWEVYVRSFKRSGFKGLLEAHDLFGAKTHDVCVPDVVCRAPNGKVALFLNRLWACEGTVHAGSESGSPPRFALGMVSKRFIVQVQMLLLRFGISGRISKVQSVHTRTGKEQMHWMLTVSGIDGLSKFLNAVGPILGKEEKCGKVADYCVSRKANTNVDVIPISWGEANEMLRRLEVVRPRGDEWLRLGVAKARMMSRSMFRKFVSDFSHFEQVRSLGESISDDVGFEKVVLNGEMDDKYEVGDIGAHQGNRFVANGIGVHNSLGYGKCVDGSTEVIDSGTGARATVSELAEFRPSLGLMTFKDGQVVGRPAKVAQTGFKKLRTIRFASGRSIRLSLDHPVLMANGWVDAGEVSVGDLVATARSIPEPEDALVLPEQEVSFVAYMIAEGTCSFSNWYFTNGSREILDEFDVCANMLGHNDETLDATKFVADAGQAETVYPRGTLWIKRKYGLNTTSHHKRIPAKFMGLRKDLLALFLNRLWACDGSVLYKNLKALELTVASEALVRDVQTALLRFGVLSRVYPKKVREFDAWQLHVTGADEILAFLDAVGPIFTKEEACNRLREHAESTTGNSNVDVVPFDASLLSKLRSEIGPIASDRWWPGATGKLGRKRFLRLCDEYELPKWCSWWGGVYWDRVKSIEDGEILEPVYDVEVPDSGCFVANGVVIHNTMMGSILMCWTLYHLSCLRSPQLAFGLSPGSEMVLATISKNLHLARTVLKSAIEDKLKLSAYFLTKFAPKRWGGDVTQFPKNIQLSIGSCLSERVLGMNVFAGVMDEANFMATKGQQIMQTGSGKKTVAQYDLAEKVYAGLVRRIKSRFQRAGGSLPGMMVLLSSANVTGSFTDRKIADVKKTEDATVFIRDYATWDVKPKEHFVGDTFKVIIGSSSLRSRVVPKDEEIDEGFLEQEGAFVINVPEEYRPDFERDLENSIRDIAGMSTHAISAYLNRIETLDWAKTDKLVHPFTTQEYTYGEPGGFIWEHLCETAERKLPGGYTEEVWRPKRDPQLLRWIHIDPALSGDCLGIAMGYIKRWMEVVRRNEDGEEYNDVAPEIIIEFMLRIHPPPGDQIFLPDVRRMCYELMNHGFHLMGFSCDKFQCLAEGTLVASSRGLVPIENVKVGDVVESRSGPRPVLNTWGFGEQDTLIIETTDGVRVEGTGRHKIEVLKGWLRENNQPGGSDPVWEWRRMDEISEGDVVRVCDWPCDVQGEYVALPEMDAVGPGGPVGLLDSWRPPSVLDEALAEWFGLVCGDGDVGRDGVRVSCHVDEIDDVERVFLGAFGVRPSAKTEENKGCVRVSSRGLVRWMEKSGLIKRAHVPSVILRSPRSVQAAFLRGLFGADGTVSADDGRVSLSTKHRSLAEDVSILLRSAFGIESRIVDVERGREGDFVDVGFQYILSLRGPRGAFFDRVGFSSTAKMRRLELHRDRLGRNLWVKVKSITPGRTRVYDLEVEGDHSYVANGIISHNSAETLQQMRRKGVKAELLSVDLTTEPYDNLKSALYERRISMYDYEPFTTEVKALEYDRLKGKIDHPVAGCFTGETRIPLLDGTCPTIAELDGREVWVYSCKPDGTIVPGKARGRKTKLTDRLLDVVLDSGAVVRCTPEHLWMLRDGSYKEARYLRPGVDRIMPIKCAWPVNGGYERLTDKNGRRMLTHHMVWAATHGQPVPDGCYVHHGNDKKTDNQPENLECMTKSEHSGHHTWLRHRMDGEYRDKARAGLQVFNESEEGRRKHSEAIRRTVAGMSPGERVARARNRSSFRSDIDRSSLEGVREDPEAINANAAARILGCGRNVVMRVLRDDGFASWDEFMTSPPGNNHKVRHVISVKLSEPVPVYDLEVDDHHNFALSAGVFVHNSKDVGDAVAGVVHGLIRGAKRMPLSPSLTETATVDDDDMSWVNPGGLVPVGPDFDADRVREQYGAPSSVKKDDDPFGGQGGLFPIIG